jgi:hypothetical protein
VPAAIGLQIIGDATYSGVTDELSSYLAAQQKKFTSEFASQTNVDSLIKFKGTTPTLPNSCIYVQQLMKDQNKTPNLIEPNNKVGFYFSGQIVPTADFKAATIVPLHYGLGESSAETDKSGKVAIDLRIQITSIIPDKNGVPASTVVTDQTIHFPYLLLPDGKEKPGEDAPSPLLPSYFALPQIKPGESSPTSMAVDVTETGTGSPDYNTAKSDISDGLKDINTDIDSLIVSVAPRPFVRLMQPDSCATA